MLRLLRSLRLLRFLIPGKTLSMLNESSFLLFEAKEAVEVIEASGGNMFVEVIQDLEINESMA